jgi:hypothetical protein
VLQFALPTETMSTIDIHKFVKYVDCYRNVSIAYRVLLKVSVTLALTERSFSKSKLIKTYMRFSMSQDRLNGLIILSIGKDILENINFDVIINTYYGK